MGPSHPGHPWPCLRLGSWWGLGRGRPLRIHASMPTQTTVPVLVREGGEIFCCLGIMSQNLGGGLCWALRTHFCWVGVLLAV